MITVGTSFSGIGVPDYAAFLLGMTVLWQIEIEPFRQKVLKNHAPSYWPNAELFGDIRGIESTQLKPVDIFVTAPPCTDISRIGNKAGLVHGAQSSLWFDALRIVRDLRPRVVIVENVSDILHRGGTRIVSDLAALDYVGRAGIISAADFGAPHLRERWWCIATLGNANSQHADDGRHDSSQFPQQQATEIRRRERWAAQSQVVTGVARNAAGLAGFEWPSGRGEPQHAWEPSRIAPPFTPGIEAKRRAAGDSWTLPNALAVMNAAKQLLEVHP